LRTSYLLWTPNARGEPPPEARARYERTLEAVGSSALLGPYAAAQPSNGKELLSVSGFQTLPRREQCLGRRGLDGPHTRNSRLTPVLRPGCPPAGCVSPSRPHLTLRRYPKDSDNCLPSCGVRGGHLPVLPRYSAIFFFRSAYSSHGIRQIFCSAAKCSSAFARLCTMRYASPTYSCASRWRGLSCSAR
jgi:hypothetical protein